MNYDIVMNIIFIIIFMRNKTYYNNINYIIKFEY